jgi:general secretion pathway protein I
MALMQHRDSAAGARRPGAAARGFTLIEILVAFTVAVLMLGAIYRVLSTGARSAAMAERQSEAVLLAQSAIEGLAGVPVAEAMTDERIGEFRRVTRVVARPDLTPPAQGMLPGRGAPLTVFNIEVRVSWREGVRERDVALSGLSLGVAASDTP